MGEGTVHERHEMGRVVGTEKRVLKVLAVTTGEHKTQVLNTPKATGMHLGLLANFGCYPNATVERTVI